MIPHTSISMYGTRTCKQKHLHRCGDLGANLIADQVLKTVPEKVLMLLKLGGT